MTRVPFFLWPLVWIWRLFATVVALTGRLVGVLLGLALMIAGAALTLTVVGAVVGVPLLVVGFLLCLRSLF
jgi:hypothetical protein